MHLEPAAASYVGTPGTNEDCLNLDIYAPVHGDREDIYAPAHRSPEKMNPVMVYFHGGSFLEGSADRYDGTFLADGGNVIVVIVNYRVGALGSIALPGLSAESADGISGNYGIQDQLAALHWVHDNIEAFGGDPDNVTIFGESAGGRAPLFIC